jgi:hypothetical protein
LNFILDKTLEVINSLEKDGVIGKYAIGGAIGAMFYTEPSATFDLDVFCFIPNSGILIDLGPLFGKLRELGYSENEEGAMVIEGIPVQFIVPPQGLEEEALEQAVEQKVYGINTRVFTYEHLLAIMAKTARSKDIGRIGQCLESREPDATRLKDILSRYNLLDKWDKIAS